MRITLGLLLACGVLGTTTSRADIKGQKPGQPDVLVLVFAVTGAGDQVGLTYPGLVPHARVQRDIRALQTATGWAITGVNIADKSPPVGPPSNRMTSADFIVQDAVLPERRYLPVQPFVEAFRPYRHVALTYFVPTGYGFQGLRRYADNHVSIALEQHGSTYTYQIFIRDGHFGRMSLPRYDLSASATRSAGAGGSAVNPWLVALVALAAVGAGCVVYAVLARNA